MLKTIFAILKKDFLMESSYRLSFVFSIFGALASVASYFFIDKLFGQRITPYLEEFGVNYFSYVLLSIAFFGYVGAGLGSFSSRLQLEQMQGTLEAFFLTPAKISAILMATALWNIIFSTLNMAIYILLGVFLFKIDFSKINFISSGCIFLLTITSFSSIGIFSAAFTMIFKRGNPLAWAVSNVEGLISGVYFPVTVLPAGFQFLAKIFPITYAIRAIELAVYKGYTPLQLKKEIGFLIFFSVLLLPLSLAAFKYSLKKARENGSLGQY